MKKDKNTSKDPTIPQIQYFQMWQILIHYMKETNYEINTYRFPNTTTTNSKYKIIKNVKIWRTR